MCLMHPFMATFDVYPFWMRRSGQYSIQDSIEILVFIQSYCAQLHHNAIFCYFTLKSSASQAVSQKKKRTQATTTSIQSHILKCSLDAYADCGYRCWIRLLSKMRWIHSSIQFTTKVVSKAFISVFMVAISIYFWILFLYISYAFQ